MTMPKPPRPDAYATNADFFAAYAAYRRQVDAVTDAQLVAAIATAGGRTTTCRHGYTFRDSCPVCD